MSRILLVHWNRDEARERATRLRRAGHTVVIHADQGGGGELRKVRNKPPDALVIDLARLPSHGRAVGVFMRQQKATRQVPLVFVDGEPEKVARIRQELPDAIYTDWRRLRGAITKAIKQPTREPVVPDTFAAYAGTPLPKKLGIEANSTVALVGAPKDFRKTLGKLPKDVKVKDQARGTAKVVLLFVKSAAELERRLAAASRAMAKGGSLWIAWPKKTSSVSSDLTQPLVRKIGMSSGLVDYKICAIDETWSGLRFARRG